MKAIVNATYTFTEENAETGNRLCNIEAVDVVYADGTTERYSGSDEVALIGGIIFQQQRTLMKAC